jgi:hypothetical protein
LIDDLPAARIEIIDKYLTENNNCCTSHTCLFVHKNVGYTCHKYSKAGGSGFVEIAKEMASPRIGRGPWLLKLYFFVSVMVDGCGCQEESGTEAANAWVNALRRGEENAKGFTTIGRLCDELRAVA